MYFPVEETTMYFPEAKLTFIEKLETAELALDKYTDNLSLRLRELKEEARDLQMALEDAENTRRSLHFTLRKVHGSKCKKYEHEGKCICV